MENFYDLDFGFYYKIYKNTHYMMERRGFKPKKEMLTEPEYKTKVIGLLAESTEEPNEKSAPYLFIDKLSIVFKKNKEQVLVYFFILDIKIKKVDMEHINALMVKKKCESVILIIREKITSRVSSIFELLNKSQIFYEKEMCVDPTAHKLSPKFRILDQDEINDLLNSYSCSLNNLPGMFKDKPIAKYFNLQVGDVVEITRNNGGLYYRTVREN